MARAPRRRRVPAALAAVALLATGSLVVADLTGAVDPRAWWLEQTSGTSGDPVGADPSPVAGGATDGPEGSDAPPADEPEAGPPPVLEPGDTGMRVRELEVRLRQLDWLRRTPTGAYDARAERAVRGFQRKRELEPTGVVDRRTWRRLLAMTVEPTRAELLHRPGPTLLASGSEGADVRDLEARLRQIAWFFGDVDDTYDAATAEAVRGFQGKRRIPVTGEVDRRTLDLLLGMTREPSADELANVPPTPSGGAPLDARCLTGRVLCIDKSSNSLRWVVDGEVRMDLDVRFGSAELPTREGQFSVFSKSRDHVSSIYDTPMPMAMFFSGGQAVHYSPDFAANGYNGASHGCVNVRDYAAISSLFDQVAIGTRVVVYWS